jgi:D-glycero-D-manno-heptose 1,7-bisphosphate phosphatase
VNRKTENGKPNRRAVFLDRDGTINVEKDYLHRPEEFEFIPGAPEAIAMLKDAGYLVVVVTNQSGVARGYYGEADVERIHHHMDELLAAYGTSVDGYYFCPHHPEKGLGAYLTDCDCRKPLPGMLLMAAAELAIDLAASWMIGDKLADMEAGRGAGCATALVLTGYGVEQAALLPEDVPVYADLLAAARAITGI